MMVMRLFFKAPGFASSREILIYFRYLKLAAWLMTWVYVPNHT